MGFKMMGLCMVAQAVLLLTVSFFVLFAVRKIEKEQGLRIFGIIIAALLWLVALVALSSGIYKMSKGNCYLRGEKKCELMKGMKAMPGMMGQHPEAPVDK
jgi:nitrogen fixation/metabolism regulation signal transduction histidine kinase